MLIIVQCNSDSCNISSEYDAFILQYFRQLAASRLDSFEIVVDDRCCPQSLINLGYVSILHYNIHSYQIEESSLFNKLNCTQVPGIVTKSVQWISCVVSITTFQ